MQYQYQGWEQNMHKSRDECGVDAAHSFYEAASRQTSDHDVRPAGRGCELVPCLPAAGACRPNRLCHARAYYNPARCSISSRYTLCEWDQNNQTNFCVARTEVDASQRTRADAWRAVHVTDKITRMRQNSNTRKLGERLADVSFWKDQLTKETAAMNLEIENLLDCKARLEKTLFDSQRMLSISEECQLQREKRTGIDQTFDTPEIGLNKEILIIRKCQRRMQKNIEKCEMQHKMNRCARHVLDVDIRDKSQTLCIDGHNESMRDCTFGIGYHPGIEDVDNTVSDPVSWAKFTQENIERSKHERLISQKCRVDVELCLRQCMNDIWSQFQFINNALKARIAENSDVKHKLVKKLKEVNSEIRDMERAVELLRCAIAEKELPMKVAQTRLDERTRRLCVEVCHDEPMKGLQTEVYELRQSVQTLKEKQRCSELALCRLLKTRSRLEAEIASKEFNIFIDSKCCLVLRDGVALDAKSGPVFNMAASAEAGATIRECGPRSKPMIGSNCPQMPVAFTGTACCN